ncbi:hypothetical protein BD560DRAFT_429387 [Blakeslea trispora]|nr:hypothetical protein BD560DRAFT_429387 [Blakeslea trispora]
MDPRFLRRVPSLVLSSITLPYRPRFANINILFISLQHVKRKPGRASSPRTEQQQQDKQHHNTEQPKCSCTALKTQREQRERKESNREHYTEEPSWKPRFETHLFHTTANEFRLMHSLPRRQMNHGYCLNFHDGKQITRTASFPTGFFMVENTRGIGLKTRQKPGRMAGERAGKIRQNGRQNWAEWQKLLGKNCAEWQEKLGKIRQNGRKN